VALAGEEIDRRGIVTPGDKGLPAATARGFGRYVDLDLEKRQPVFHRLFVSGSEDAPTLTLHYRWRDAEDILIPIRLEPTPTQFGGRRWWFIRPLIVRGVPCERRAGKLYLPPGARYFGYRKCHDLTYRSCQEAHQSERLFGRLALDAEIARLWERR
jgi:hypothetical protein